MGNKNGDSENKNIFDKDASSLFNNAFEEIKKEDRKSLEELASEENRDRHDETVKFYEQVLLKFKEASADSENWLELFSQASRALKKTLLGMNDGDAYGGAIIFGNIYFRIKIDEGNFLHTGSAAMQKIVMRDLYESLRSNGVDFCIEKLKEQIDKSTLPESLVLLTDLRSSINGDKLSFEPGTNQLLFAESLMVQAATLLIDDIERRINLKATEIEISKQLGINEQLGILEIDAGIDTALTKRQWLIAFRFFINYFNLRSINNTDFGRFLAVLNNGKNYQEFRAGLGNEKGLITKQTCGDAQKVADLFRQQGLPQIAEEIESAINRIDDNIR